MTLLKRVLIVAALCIPFGLVPAGTPAGAAPVWAPAATAPIHPGVQTVTGGGQCTANFIYYDASNVYIGQAAHCSGTDGNTATDGCSSHTLPVGTTVEVGGASNPGVMVYNSWATMQQNGEANPDTCAYNDLALVRLDPADPAKVKPSIPVWGGPVAVNSTGLALGDQIYSYGNSSLRLGITALSPKTGISNGDDGGGWSHAVTMVLPGIPGDSGSALLDTSGRATGILSTLGISIPGGGTNFFGDVG